MKDEIETEEVGLFLGESVMTAVADWQHNAPRTAQSRARVLGMSEMGGCREYIRATIAGDVKGYTDKLKWPAFVGTALGDMIEDILGQMGFVTQEDVVLTLNIGGTEMKVSGHLDARTQTAVIDLKTNDELDAVRRDGPSFKQKAQISGYLIGLVQQGKLDEDATGHLIFLDRSGKQSDTYVWSVNVERARLILSTVVERLEQVASALATGFQRGYLRDEPESYCWAISCPFYDACWDGYVPTGQITHPRELEAVQRFVQARDDMNGGDSRRKAAREELRGVEGITPDGTIVRWTLSENPSGVGVSDRLDVRLPKGK